MRIAIVGAGLTGLSAARLLGEDPRHVATVLESRARFGGDTDARLIADSVEYLSRLGVTLRHSAHVERLAVDDVGVDVWVNGRPERFDLVLVTTAPADTGALFAPSGLRPDLGSIPLHKRVYFTEPGAVDPGRSARAALLRIAADHPGVAPRETPPRVAHVSDVFPSRARGHVEYLDLSGQSWPLGAPAVYIANQRWILDAVPRQLGLRSLRTPTSDERDATAGELESGRSVAFVVEGDLPARGLAPDAPHGRGAALAALAVNAPIVPIAATDQPPSTSRMRLRRSRAKALVVIGVPFYPETSSIDELMDDMRRIVRHLEQLATEHAQRPRRLSGGESEAPFVTIRVTDRRGAMN